MIVYSKKLPTFSQYNINPTMTLNVKEILLSCFSSSCVKKIIEYDPSN